jgi:thioredoxin 1
VSKVRETNDFLLPEEIAAAGPVLVLFDVTEGFKENAMAQAFLSVAQQHDGAARFFRVNIDENPSVAEAYKLKRVPTVAVFADGKELGRRSGIQGDQAILDLLARKTKKPSS